MSIESCFFPGCNQPYNRVYAKSIHLNEHKKNYRWLDVLETMFRDEIKSLNRMPMPLINEQTSSIRVCSWLQSH